MTGSPPCAADRAGPGPAPPFAAGWQQGSRALPGGGALRRDPAPHAGGRQAMTHPLIPELRRARVVPVVRTSTAALAATACAMAARGGDDHPGDHLDHPGRAAADPRMPAEPGLLIGAGTVPDARTAEACLDAGAKFLVTPWTDPGVIRVAREAGACAMPGAMTPTEIRAALAAGADVVKIFPASSAGAPRTSRRCVRSSRMRCSARPAVSMPAMRPPTSRPGPPSSASAASWWMRRGSPPATRRRSSARRATRSA